MTDAVRAYRERLLDLVVNRSDVRMNGAVQYVPRGKETLEIFDAALAELLAVIERQGKELEKSEELVLRLNEAAASLVRRVHTYITSDSDARDKLANGVGHDMSRIPSLEPFLAQRVTEGGDHD